MAIIEHLDTILGALGGGIITQLANWGINRKKGKSEVGAMEIDNIKKIVDEVYKPLINQQNTRIHELEGEIQTLRKEREEERQSYQKQIDALQKQIVSITRAMGLTATEHARNSKGQFVKKEQ